MQRNLTRLENVELRGKLVNVDIEVHHRNREAELAHTTLMGMRVEFEALISARDRDLTASRELTYPTIGELAASSSQALQMLAPQLGIVLTVQHRRDQG